MYKAANVMSGSEMEEEQYDELFLVLEEPQGGYTVPPPSVPQLPVFSLFNPAQPVNQWFTTSSAQPTGPANSALHH